MQTFDSAGVEIAYQVEGEGKPILLIHGFASNARVNWVATGWVKFLAERGRQVIAMDNRGHGFSEKLHDPAAYPATEMAEDARRLIEHLGFDRVDVMGYSMGARIAAFLAIRHPARVQRVVLAGLAENMIRGLGGSETIARALEAQSLADVDDPVTRPFRLFAEQTGSDLKALAACMRASRQRITAQDLSRIKVPVLVVAGGDDAIAGAVEPLVAAIAGARGVTLPGKDHMKAVGAPDYKRAVVEFLGL
jgi:pimeloyl-ACP methyl ester carboxylesterase